MAQIVVTLTMVVTAAVWFAAMRRDVTRQFKSQREQLQMVTRGLGEDR
jgi:hypothetical protein